MKDRTYRIRVGKQLAKRVVDLDTGKREIIKVELSDVRKDILAWVMQFKLAVRGLIRRSIASKQTYTGKTPQDRAKEPREH